MRGLHCRLIILVNLTATVKKTRYREGLSVVIQYIPAKRRRPAACRGSRRRERTRRRLARTQRRRDWQHQVSRSLAGGTVVVEALRTRAMTASAKGTRAAPGRNVRQKAGLNRGILATV